VLPSLLRRVLVHALPPLLALTLAAGAPAAEPGADSPPPPEAKPQQGPNGAEQEDDEDENWLDVGHSYIEERIFAPIFRFDRFFSDERDIEPERSRSFVRWRNEVRFAEDETGPVFTTGIRAELRLPGLDRRLRRLRLVITGETREAVESLFPRERTRPGTRPRGEDEDDLGRGGDAGLRLRLWDTLATHGDIGAGVLARLPPGVYGRVRLRWAAPVEDWFLARAAVSGFWQTDTRFGSSAVVDFERPLSPLVVARLAGIGTWTEASRGLEWLSELAVLATLGEHSAAQVALAMEGASEASAGVERYRVYTRLRRDVYRRWLFMEIEPQVSWPFTAERGRYAAWGLALRLEVQFHGADVNAGPPPPRERRDPDRPADPDPTEKPERRIEPEMVGLRAPAPPPPYALPGDLGPR
jgi:hypothetical protein